MAEYGYGENASDETSRGYTGSSDSGKTDRPTQGPGATVPANVLAYLELQGNLIEMIFKEVADLENGISPILRDIQEKDPGARENDMDSPDMAKVTRLIDQHNRSIRQLIGNLRSIKNRVNL